MLGFRPEYFENCVRRDNATLRELSKVVENYIKLFADDTNLYACVDTDDQRNSLQKDLDSVMNWSDRWQLRFNTSKCKHLHST